MPLRFALPQPGGGVSILSAAPKEHLERLLGFLTDEAYRAHVLERNGLTEADVVEPSEIPEDRTFRDAWSLGERQVTVDMPKAKEIHLGRIRRARDAKLPELDVQWTRASARKDQAAADAVEIRRQTLRDLPKTFDLSKATTPDDLKKLWPAELA